MSSNRVEARLRPLGNSLRALTRQTFALPRRTSLCPGGRDDGVTVLAVPLTYIVVVLVSESELRATCPEHRIDAT